ncbi:Gfo/Idh/MocA family protein [Paenibacillus solisilvae]|uniref:Gfo/Idh/MocA family protein n=1 Tax=Paenibacillus solisilvae TaxID=2486751 RepID=A0ABW0W1E3_9BACL
MKFAVVGCQHVHIKMFIDEMLELGHQFVGIYDQSEYFLPKQYSQDYKVPLIQRLDDLLDQGVGIIGNAARNDEKIDFIEWGEKHGIHVMTDKPIAVDEAGLKRLKQVIDRGKIKVGMMLTERFEPTLYTLKQLIADGEMGELMDFTFLKPHKMNRTRRPDWFFENSVNGGLIIDILIHDVDLLGWLTGKKMVSYQGHLIKSASFEFPDFYDNAQMNILLEDQITATLKSDWLMPDAFDSWGDGRIFVTGSKGRVEIRSAGDILGQPGPYITLSTHQQKARRLDVLKVPNNLSGDFINQIEGKPYRLSAQEIYECNATVIRMDAAANKLMKSKNG